MVQSNVSNPQDFPFIIIGNKIDVDDSKKIPSLSKKLNNITNNQMGGLNYPVFETSAKDGVNVEAAFEVIAKMALQQEELNASNGNDVNDDYNDAINIHLDSRRVPVAVNNITINFKYTGEEREQIDITNSFIIVV